jgi:hypothetical protein
MSLSSAKEFDQGIFFRQLSPDAHLLFQVMSERQMRRPLATDPKLQLA